MNSWHRIEPGDVFELVTIDRKPPRFVVLSVLDQIFFYLWFSDVVEVGVSQRAHLLALEWRKVA